MKHALWDSIRDPEAGYFSPKFGPSERLLLIILAEGASSEDGAPVEQQGTVRLSTVDLLTLTGFSRTKLNQCIKALEELRIIRRSTVNGARLLHINRVETWQASDDSHRDEVVGNIARQVSANDSKFAQQRRGGRPAQARSGIRDHNGVVRRRPEPAVPLTVEEVETAVAGIETEAEMISWLVENSERIPEGAKAEQLPSFEDDAMFGFAEAKPEASSGPKFSPQEQAFRARLVAIRTASAPRLPEHASIAHDEDPDPFDIILQEDK